MKSMKTFLECKREAAKILKASEYLNMDSYSMGDYIEITDLAAKLYAVSVLDAVAEEIPVINKTFYEREHPVNPQRVTIIYDPRPVIQMIKDQLK